MTVLNEIFSYFTSDIQTTVITLSIGLIIYKVSKFYVRVFTLPPGPTPWPLLGNISLFMTKNHFDIELRKISKKYGPVFTVWMGPTPFVFISDIDIAREAFKKNEFSGRPDTWLCKLISNDNFADIVFTDYNHKWEALRRVGHSAAQKYATNDKLVYLASDCVDRTIKLIINKEGIDKPFVPRDYIYYTFLNILATSAFGQSYSTEDKEYKLIREYLIELEKALLYWQISPVVRLIFRKQVQKYKQLLYNTLEMLRTKFSSHYKDYDESVDRDFCDALISAKNDALREGKESAPYLTDVNLAMVVWDLFIAGTETSQQTTQWLLLLLAYYPNVQKKLRQEIESEIGDRIPTHEDRSGCHYVMAFISETLRFRNVLPGGVFHNAVVTSKIDKYTIPKGTGICVYQGGILNDDKYWSNPDQFSPERFLENGKYMTTRPKAYIPFGVGRRVCLGEKLAIADLFLVLVRFLQSTSDYDIALAQHSGIEVDPSAIFSYKPKQYKICFKNK